MKKIILIAIIICLFAMPAQAQVFDLVRSVNTFGLYLQDTKANDYTQTGTLEISGSTIRRIYTICQNGKCIIQDIQDELIGASDYRALVSGDSGDFATITILSLSPTIIIMEATTSGQVSIEEYKPR